jgi:hypothetical protein
MSADELADWQAAIAGAADMDELKQHYLGAVKIARARKDKLSEDALTASKDARKKQLESADQPQGDLEDQDIPY